MGRFGRSPRRTVAALALVAAACVISTTNHVERTTLRPGATSVESPTRVHLADGSVAVFLYGVSVDSAGVHGDGRRYSPLRDSSTRVGIVPLDSVVGAESYTRSVNEGRTLVYSAATTVGSIALFKAIFGSCPTIYSGEGDSARLESEAFSYSIAPLLEKRDLDVLAAQPDAAGELRLEVRNEALETHHIDHVELIEVAHRAGETVLPAPYGDPVAFSAVVPVTTARDRAGRDVRRVLAAADDVPFGTDDSTLARAIDDERAHEDWIDVTVPRPAGADSVAVVLRMRSSLLTTVLFYDYMLARPGARSLDWTARDLGRITTVAGLGRWYTRELGLRVQVQEGGAYRQVARLVDFGPIAWRNVAVVVPATSDSVRIRLAFLADEWRIDRVAVAGRVRRVAGRAVPVSRVTDGDGREHADARDAIASPDARRLATSPGQRMRLHFLTGPARDGGARTFLFAAQGYYTEWIRGAWLRAPADTLPFDPARVKLGDVLRTWRERRPAMERDFFAQRVPVA